MCEKRKNECEQVSINASNSFSRERGTYEEVSVVLVAVGVDEGALALHLARHPHAVVHGPVRVVVHALR